MRRRKMIQNLLLGVATGGALPVWAARLAQITPDNTRLLAELVDTLLPKTDTPGAKELKVHEWILKIVQDCYDVATQQRFQAALKRVNTAAQQSFQQNFVDCSTEQRLKVLQNMLSDTTSEDYQAIQWLKQWIVNYYMKSQYAMENILNYEFAPARYHGCKRL